MSGNNGCGNLYFWTGSTFQHGFIVEMLSVLMNEDSRLNELDSVLVRI